MKEKLYLFFVLCFVGLGVLNAQTEVSGVVVDEFEEPVIGATIQIKGTSSGTITNIDGEFTLSAPANGTLVVSYVGMITQEVAVGSHLRIVLASDTKMLDEVIAIAYGTTKRSSFTGSAATVNAQSIEKRPLTSVVSALEGNTAGVQATSTLGQPGESASIRIRGFGSVNASNSPLYVVDGAVYNGNLSNINPADIESMTILKDAASTALYGSSAGNGVVLVTTKKGKEGANISFSMTQGWSQRAYKDYEQVSVWDYYPLQWEMLRNSYITSGDAAEVANQKASANIVSTLKYNPFAGVKDSEVMLVNGQLNPNATALKWGDDLDWEDAAYNTGHRQEYNLNYSNKNEKSDTYASIGYLNDVGYMMKTDFERYSARLNYNINPKKWIKTGLNLALTHTNSNYSASTSGNSSGYNNLTMFIRSMAPIYPVHKHDLETGAYLNSEGKPTTNPDEYVYDYEGARLSNNGRDAIAETELNMRDIARMNSSARTYVTLIPLQGLSVTANYALEMNDLRRKVYENPYVGDGTAGPGRLNILSSRTMSETFNQLVTYEKSIDSHSFDVLVGHESYAYKYEYYYSMKVGQSVPGVYDYPNFTQINSLNSYTDNYRKEGYLGRLNWNYDDRYYLSFSYRRDGSSRFQKDNRWGNFYSVGGSWRLSNEAFMEHLHWLDNMRIRASYGETGVDRILDSDGDESYYPYQKLYQLGINNALEAGAFYSTFANNLLRWEKQASTDIALEFDLFNRLNGVVEFFNKDSRDLLFDVSIPGSLGATSQVQNIGKSRNIGLELGLDFQAVNTKDWKVNVGFNVTTLTNKIVRLPDSNRESGIISSSKKFVEGKSMYEFWLRQWYGVNPSNGDGLFYFDSESYSEKEGNLTDAVKKSLITIDGEQLTNSYQYARYDFSGRSIPNLYGGFNFNVSFKGISLEALFSFATGAKALDLRYANMMSMSNYGYSMHEDVANAWRQTGDVKSVPRLDNNSTHSTSIGQSYSTRWLVSGNYLNFRSLVLGYDVPRKMISKLDLKTVRLTLGVENLLMWKARNGLNPQGNYSGVTYNEYMPARTVTFGLNVTL